jgi:hypothetical protein
MSRRQSTLGTEQVKFEEKAEHRSKDPGCIRQVRLLLSLSLVTFLIIQGHEIQFEVLLRMDLELF